MRRIALALGLAGAIGGACAHGESKPTVSDADFGRLGPDQMGPVNEARQFAMSARDEQARARARLSEVQHEGDLAKADQQAAKATGSAAEAQAKIANDSRDPAQLERAREAKERAQLQTQTADAHADYAAKVVQARQTAVDAADKQVALGNARLELAKLHALQTANIPASQKYDEAKLQGAVNDAQKSFSDTMDKARSQDGQAVASHQRWQDLQRQLQAKATPVPAG